ncbi:SagB-type dehydrogenase family enzyme [Thermosporothrix hazakensis]|jgi:SagB-type dehydrogenase family enzyme|uniref:SagB-type dehydrogenase family enzyme n=2 Tax=Thermosporothrix TaxID=768650 RepID=A0A326U6J0_THEHA|nr:SagB family peptide dehydrogenase [Thermosporothrix hazakensis]PZW29212.1 SagB-type dehydrogenase family enzyme [Thermosporothrix hazakensis]BBH86142.1 hypothetical protein KTC_08930 [Thermosporothrix sp. COM3]GCE45436.1 hypothetical protein KTH_03050 [Thermosporothrix hazakensis]
MSEYNYRAALAYHAVSSYFPGDQLAVSEYNPKQQPLLYKKYTSLEPIALPKQLASGSISALQAVAASEQAANRVPDLQTLARLCYYTSGLTRPDEEKRAAACTGGLYHFELYLVCGDLADLPAGVYHYGAHDHSLRRLRSGDFRRVLLEATGNETAVAHAPVLAIFTDTFWRNSCKFGPRTYRHTFWDNGTLLANLHAVATSAELPFKLIESFADDIVNSLLAIDGYREAAISLAALGATAEEPGNAPVIEELELPTEPLSPKEEEYPLIEDIHEATLFSTGEESATWRDAEAPFPPHAAPEGTLIPLRPMPLDDWPTAPIEQVIQQRSSAHRFAQQPLSFEKLSTILLNALHLPNADCFDPAGRPLNDIYLLVNNVSDLKPGAYILHPEQKALELLKEGDFRKDATHLAFDQKSGGEAAVSVYSLIALEELLIRDGNRGYRVAQLESGIFSGNAQLAAAALGLGATGLEYYDNEVITFFSPSAKEKQVMSLFALGERAE